MNKKIMYNITLILVLVIMLLSQLTTVCATEQRGDIITTFDATTNTFSFEGNLPNLAKKFITIMIAPSNTSTISKEDLSSENVILKTAQVGFNGEVNVKITLPELDNVSRYVYNVAVDEIATSAMVSTVAESELEQYLPTINTGGLEEARAFVNNDSTGLDDGNEKETEFIAYYIDEVKPESGYTASALLDAYMLGEGIGYVKAGIVKLDEFFVKYSHYFDSDYTSGYEKLSEEKKNALNNAFINNGVAKNFDTTYKNNLFVAEFTMSKNPAELKKVLLSYFKENNVSLEEFNKINNAVYEEKVFDELFIVSSEFKTLSSILDAFNDEVEKQKAEADKKASSGGGSGSGGVSGGGSGSGNGAGSSAVGTHGEISVDTVTSIFSFKDLEGHWAKSYVDEMYKRGIINGFSDDTFKPDLNVTRAEFAKMIAMILKLDVLNNSTFSDVSDESWYSGYVAALEKTGIVTGADGKFMPDAYITRQDAAVIIARALKYKGKTFSSETFNFSDESMISEYAKDSVNAMARLGIITGYNGKFDPLENTTRGQAAALLMRVSDFMK